VLAAAELSAEAPPAAAVAAATAAARLVGTSQVAVAVATAENNQAAPQPAAQMERPRVLEARQRESRDLAAGTTEAAAAVAAVRSM